MFCFIRRYLTASYLLLTPSLERVRWRALVPGRGGRLRGVLLERKRVGVPGNERKTATFHFAFCPLAFRFFDHQRLLSPRVDDGIHEAWARQKDVSTR